jgi:hypothetical protein
MNYWLAHKFFYKLGPIKVKLLGGQWSGHLNTYHDGEYERPDGTATFKMGFLSWTARLPNYKELKEIRYGKAA